MPSKGKKYKREKSDEYCTRGVHKQNTQNTVGYAQKNKAQYRKYSPFFKSNYPMKNRFT
jgi:hypothetical protein